MRRWTLPRGLLLGWAAGVLSVALAGGIFAAAVLFGGLYNTSATDQHLRIVAWAFHRTMTSSVSARAGPDRQLPPPDAAAILAGARDYQAHCIACHGGPGVARARWVSGLLPSPPFLLETSRRLSRPELYKIVHDGVKMTAMPAWGGTLPDESISRIVDFLEVMPKLTPAQFARLRQRADASGQFASSVAR